MSALLFSAVSAILKKSLMTSMEAAGGDSDGLLYHAARPGRGPGAKRRGTGIAAPPPDALAAYGIL